MSRQKVAVIGLGYVGLPLSIAISNTGMQVTGVDKSEELVIRLNAGLSHIEDVSDAQLTSALETSLLVATNDYSAISECSIVIICVPTPLDDQRNPNLIPLQDAIRSVAQHLAFETLLISESTSYPGTARDLIAPIIQELNPSWSSILIASAPERVDPGNPKFGHTNTPRIVGGLTQEATTRAAAFYRTFTEQVIEVSSPEVAEAAKLLENTFRQVNIALVNEIAQVMRALNVDVREVIEAASTKPYGFMPFQPGAGVGGHCIPVDPSYLSWSARGAGAEARFIDLANEVNLEMPKYVAQRLLQRVVARGTLSGILVILGVAYKSGVADTRETPASHVADALEGHGFIVGWSDPLVSTWRNSEPINDFSHVVGAIVVTAQPGVQVDQLLQLGIPILDCTGTYRGIQGVEQL